MMFLKLNIKEMIFFVRIFDIYKCETENAFYEIEVMEGMDLQRMTTHNKEIDELISNIISAKLILQSPTIIIAQFDIKTGMDFELAYCINNTIVLNLKCLIHMNLQVT